MSQKERTFNLTDTYVADANRLAEKLTKFCESDERVCLTIDGVKHQLVKLAERGNKVELIALPVWSVTQGKYTKVLNYRNGEYSQEYKASAFDGTQHAEGVRESELQKSVVFTSLILRIEAQYSLQMEGQLERFPFNNFFCASTNKEINHTIGNCIVNLIINEFQSKQNCKLVKQGALPYFQLLMAIFKQMSLKDATAYKFCCVLTKEFKPVVEKFNPNADYMKKWFLYAKAPNAQICAKWDDIYSNMHAESHYILCDCVPFSKGRSNE